MIVGPIQVCVIEDESHFLLICPLFNELRDNYLRNVITYRTFNNFLELMCSNDISVLLKISLFVKHGMRKRHGEICIICLRLLKCVILLCTLG